MHIASVVPTGLIGSIALLHPSSKLLGYFHQAPTGLTSAQRATGSLLPVPSVPAATLAGEPPVAPRRPVAVTRECIANETV